MTTSTTTHRPSRPRQSATDSGERPDLDERAIAFARSVRGFVRKLPRSLANLNDSRQLIRSSGSLGARFVEATEAYDRKEFFFKTLLSLKSAKESAYWLALLDTGDVEKTAKQRDELLKESEILQRIMGSIVSKARDKNHADTTGE